MTHTFELVDWYDGDMEVIQKFKGENLKQGYRIASEYASYYDGEVVDGCELELYVDGNEVNDWSY